MRNFLERHSSLYRWAGAQKAEAAEGWEIISRQYEHDLSETVVAHRREKDELRRIQVDATRRLIEQHEADIAAHDSANHRLRQTNRDLVAALKDRGFQVEEYPATKCPSCDGFAAVAEDGRHRIGTVRYPDHTAPLYCDGSEQ